MVGGPPAQPTLGPVGRAALQTLTQRIADGVYPPGSKLPGERDLAESLRVSRMVLRDALAALAADGVLESSPWRGWFVQGAKLSERVELQSFTERARANGMVPTARVLGRRTRPLTRAESASLGLPAGASAIETFRVRALDSRDVCLDRSLVPLDRAPGFESVSLEDASLYDSLEETCGVRVVRSDYTIRAASADRAVAEKIGVLPGDPVLIAEEVVYDESDLAVNLGETIFRSDAYEFNATLFRPATL